MTRTEIILGAILDEIQRNPSNEDPAVKVRHAFLESAYRILRVEHKHTLDPFVGEIATALRVYIDRPTEAKKVP